MPARCEPTTHKLSVGPFWNLKSANFPRDGPSRRYVGSGRDKVGVPAEVGWRRGELRMARNRTRMPLDAAKKHSQWERCPVSWVDGAQSLQMR